MSVALTKKSNVDAWRCYVQAQSIVPSFCGATKFREYRREARFNHLRGATPKYQTIKPHYPSIDNTVLGYSLFTGWVNTTLWVAESILLAVVRFRNALYTYCQSKTRPLLNLESNVSTTEDITVISFLRGELSLFKRMQMPKMIERKLSTAAKRLVDVVTVCIREPYYRLRVHSLALRHKLRHHSRKWS